MTPLSESLAEKWRKIPLGAGAVVAGMCADELAARDAEIRKLVEPMKCRGVHCNDVECTFHHGVTTCIRCRILALLDAPDEGHGYMGLGHGQKSDRKGQANE